MNDTLINGEALGASQIGTLLVVEFLQSNYLFRRNVLNGKVEFLTRKMANKQPNAYRTLTQEALNSIVLCAKSENICESGMNPGRDMV